MKNKIKLIAETAWHHEGDFEFIKVLSEKILSDSKADIIKFHLLLDIDEYIDRNYSLFNTLNKWMLKKEQLEFLLELTINNEKELMLLFNDKKSVDFGMKFNPYLIEVHSTCLNDIHLLEHIRNNISKTQKIVLGVGGSTLYEIENAIEILQSKNIILMFGFQNYPTEYANINLRKVKKIMQMFPDFEYGFADHTAWNEKNNVLITLLEATLGMNYIEKHVTHRFGVERCDWQAAITIEMFNEIADKLRILEQLNGDGLLGLNAGEKKYSTFGPMKKAPFISKDVTENDFLTLDNLIFKRSNQESDLSQLDVLEKIGSKFRRNLKANSILNSSHFTRE
ncbi:MAG: N-acetylneuraminate synthase family protein [Melioribacteraceae bacterium]|jgi:N,N'-diacetyllegionaminate synthase|nr:MAG: N-acetylneuraminate synthase family protein [Melioribacteraceae bacterium]